MSVSERVSELRDQLAALTYGVDASDFVRFRVDPTDDTVASIVRDVTALGEEGVSEFRHRIDVGDADTLRLFALRRVLQGRRLASLNLIGEAVDGFALQVKLDDVPWESWLKAALFVARSLGCDLEIMRIRFSELATRGAAARFDVAVESMNRVDSLLQCHVIEVATTHGTGFVEILVFRDTTTGGLWGAPRLGDNKIVYYPISNLAQLAVNLADDLDASGDVVTGPIGQDQLAAALFSLSVPGSYLLTAGCLSFVAGGVHGGSSFTVFAAEPLEDANVASLASAATGIEGQASVCDADRIVVMCLQPSFEENAEADVNFSIHDFEDLARSALLSSAVSTWHAN